MSNGLDFWRGLPMNPWRELSHLQRTTDRLFDELNGNSRRGVPAIPNAFNPTCEVSEDKAAFHFKFDLPGIPKDQIKIELEENRLTVTGERREEKKEQDKENKTHFSEVAYGSYARTFSLPTPVDSEKVQATYDHGVLSLTVPKTAASKARQITIK